MDAWSRGLSDHEIDTRIGCASRHLWKAWIVRPRRLREFELLGDVRVESHEQQADVLVWLVVDLAVIGLISSDTISLPSPGHDVQSLLCHWFEATAAARIDLSDVTEERTLAAFGVAVIVEIVRHRIVGTIGELHASGVPSSNLPMSIAPARSASSSLR